MRTHHRNAFADVVTRVVDGGADITISALRDFCVMPELEETDDGVTIHLRRSAGPHIGEQIMVGKRSVTVADRRWDSHGRMQVRDEDSGVWYVYDQDGRRNRGR